MRIYILLAAALIWAGCSEEAVPEDISGPYCIPEGLKARIRTDTVLKAPVTESRRLTGEVDYNPDKVLQYHSLVSGVITSTWFALGDYVKKGEKMAEIKSSELSMLESERKSLEAKLAVASRNAAAVQAMYDDGIASEKDLLEARSEAQVVRAELERTHTNLSFFSPGDQPDLFIIRAPANGFVVDKNITAGVQVAGGGEPLFVISDLTDVWVTANVYAGDLTYVREGMPVSLKTIAYKDEVFTGTIKALSQVFDAEEKVLKARIVMQNPDLKLKPGMFIDVLVKKETGREGLRVPHKAIIFNNNRNYLVVYKDDCALEIREVEMIGDNNGDAFIADGVTEGEIVLTRNHLLVFEALESAKK